MDVSGNDIPFTILQILRHNYLHFFAITCLYYDHFLTFDGEVEFIWKRRKSHSSLWFFLNRYLAFFGNLVVTVVGLTALSLSDTSCRHYSLFRQTLLIVQQVIVCTLLTLRTYALYGRSLRVLRFLLGSGVVLAGVCLWAMFGQKSAPSQIGSGCHIGLSKVTAIRLASAWQALFVYDCLIFGLTVAKAWSTRRDHAVTGISVPLVTLVLKDGAIYFAVMGFGNFMNMVSFYFGGPFLRGGLSTFASNLSVTMMSRLMLNLHESAEEGVASTVQTNTNVDYASNYETGVVELDTVCSSVMMTSISVQRAPSLGAPSLEDIERSVPSSTSVK